MAKQDTRRAGSTPLRGKPRSEDGAIDFHNQALDIVDEDQQLAATVGEAIRDFIKGLAAFFVTAKALEQSAFGTLEQAKLLKLPTNPDEDEAIQRFVKQTSVDKREVEEHWRITSLVSQFHRRMTARRSKATDALEEANRIGNRLHNSYTEAEKRKAAEAQERLRREAEEKARRDREAEIARMEAEAIKREESSPDLSEREQVFVDQVANHGDGQRAARMAGYKDPGASASRLLASAKIQKAIKAKRDAIAIRTQLAARKEEPLEVEEVPEIKPNVTRAGAAYDRTTHSAEILDEQALIAACISGKYGIPTDILTVKPAKVNEYARALQQRIELWPGVRYKRETRVI
jgi:hypothetical protein